MIDILGIFSGNKKQVISAEEEEVTDYDIQIATCALLLEMANIDDEFSDVEREHIASILKEEYGLSVENVIELEDAAKQELENNIDLWKFTHLINKYYSHEEKIRVIELVWRVVYADGRIDQHEDYLVHKLANLLNLTHRELIDAKLIVLDANEEDQNS